MKTRKPLGSDVFGTDLIRTDEVLMLAGVMKQNGSPTEEAMLSIYAIGDMLSMQRMRLINNAVRYTATGRTRKDATLSDMINSRLDLLIQELKTQTTSA